MRFLRTAKPAVLLGALFIFGLAIKPLHAKIRNDETTAQEDPAPNKKTPRKRLTLGEVPENDPNSQFQDGLTYLLLNAAAITGIFSNKPANATVKGAHISVGTAEK